MTSDRTAVTTETREQAREAVADHLRACFGERTRTERVLREASSVFDEAIRANRRTLSKRTHKRIEDIITEAHSCRPT